MHGSYKIVCEFNNSKLGKGWLTEHQYFDGEEDAVRHELHILFKGQKTLIVDDTEFIFLKNTVEAAKDKATERAEEFYAKELTA